MRFLANENFSLEAVEALRQQRHDDFMEVTSNVKAT
jgi:hypothetical protein